MQRGFPTRMVGLAVFLGLLLAGSPPAGAGDWPHYNGPEHDRTSLEAVSLKREPTVAWKIATNAGFSSFVVGGGRAYTVVTRALDGQDREVCIAVDVETGGELWSAPAGPGEYDGSGDAGAKDNRGGDGPRSTPAYQAGRVYVLDARLVLHCLDAGTGKPLWRQDIVQMHEGRLIRWQNATSPLVEQGRVFVAGGGPGQSLLAFDAATGELAWAAHDELMTHATPVAATIAGVRQVIFVTQAGLVSVAAKTGEELWRQPYPYKVSSAASPVVYGDIVYYSAGYGVGAGAYAVKKAGGQYTVDEIWRQPNKLINHWSTPVCKDGYLYGMFSFKQYGRGPLQCVELGTGQVKWSADGFGPGNCIVVGDRVVALSDAGEVVLVEADPQEYREVFRSDVLDGKCWSSPAFSDGALFVRSTTEGAALTFP